MSPYCRRLVAYVRGELGLSEVAAVRWLNKTTPLWGLFPPDIKEPDIMTSIFLTPYDYETKQPAEHSAELPFTTLEDAAQMMGRAPDIKQGKTWVWFTGQGAGAVCLSPVCFNPILPKQLSKRAIKMRQRFTPDVRKEQILTAALSLAATRGYLTVTRDQVADASGVSTALIQYHFKTMAQFRRSLMRHAIAKSCLRVLAQGLACGDEHACKAPDDLKQRAVASLGGAV